jgi:hypothetical protein
MTVILDMEPDCVFRNAKAAFRESISALKRYRHESDTVYIELIQAFAERLSNRVRDCYEARFPIMTGDAIVKLSPRVSTGEWDFDAHVLVLIEDPKDDLYTNGLLCWSSFLGRWVGQAPDDDLQLQYTIKTPQAALEDGRLIIDTTVGQTIFNVTIRDDGSIHANEYTDTQSTPV